MKLEKHHPSFKAGKVCTLIDCAQLELFPKLWFRT